MKKRFVILIDFSSHSENLLRYAYNWSQQVNANIAVVHQTTVIVPGMTDRETKKEWAKSANDEAINQLKELCRRVIPLASNVSYHASEENIVTIVHKLLSHPYNHLVFLNLKEESELLERVLLGSTSIKLIEHTNNIIVAVPGYISDFSIRNIYVAVNYKYPFSISGLKNFFSFTGYNSKNVTFFSLVEENENTPSVERHLCKIEDAFKDDLPTSCKILHGLDFKSGIRSLINNTDELLVIQRGSRLLTDYFTRKFTINELVFDGTTPLIILP